MTESLGSLYLYAHLDPCLCEHNSIVKISSSCTILALSYQQLSHCMEKKEAYPSTPSHCEAGSCFKYSAKISHYQFYSSGLHTHIFTGFLCCFSVIERLCTALVILQKSTRLEETAITDKADQVLFCFQGYKCTPCPETWLQYGENCYYFSKEWKTWQESKARCSALESRFLKIESKKELSYGSYSFWTGLSHNGSEGPWLWEDGSAFSTDLSRPFLECVWLQGSNIGTAQCGEYKFCICEKMVDPAVIEQVNYSDRQ
uniref:C-type lectin domain-containing protein n=1 Tax=Anas platyrhynchos TaxID=8839 RepID=A0A8B9T975_ANAPL